MKPVMYVIAIGVIAFGNSNLEAQTSSNSKAGNKMFIDVHYLPAGKVDFKDVAAAHAKDLAVQHKHGMQFIKYWVDESKGTVYCLSSAPDSATVRETHREAHGLLPQEILEVTDGPEGMAKGNGKYFIDVHELGAGHVTAADVAKAHEKDLAAQGKFGVNFINYWVDEKKGTVVCLSQAADSSKVIATHKAAHGLIPVSVEEVKQGQ